MNKTSTQITTATVQTIGAPPVKAVQLTDRWAPIKKLLKPIASNSREPPYSAPTVYGVWASQRQFPNRVESTMSVHV